MPENIVFCMSKSVFSCRMFLPELSLSYLCTDIITLKQTLLNEYQTSYLTLRFAGRIMPAS